jgi:hypothetical protein
MPFPFLVIDKNRRNAFRMRERLRRAMKNTYRNRDQTYQNVVLEVYCSIRRVTDGYDDNPDPNNTDGYEDDTEDEDEDEDDDTEDDDTEEIEEVPILKDKCEVSIPHEISYVSLSLRTTTLVPYSFVRQFPKLVNVILDILIFAERMDRYRDYPHRATRYVMSTSIEYISYVQTVCHALLDASSGDAYMSAMNSARELCREIGGHDVLDRSSAMGTELYADCDRLYHLAGNDLNSDDNDLDLMFNLYIAINSWYKYDYERLPDPKGYTDKYGK